MCQGLHLINQLTLPCICIANGHTYTPGVAAQTCLRPPHLGLPKRVGKGWLCAGRSGLKRILKSAWGWKVGETVQEVLTTDRQAQCPRGHLKTESQGP